MQQFLEKKMNDSFQLKSIFKDQTLYQINTVIPGKNMMPYLYECNECAAVEAL